MVKKPAQELREIKESETDNPEEHQKTTDKRAKGKMIKISCPQCGTVYELDDSLNGRRGECAVCKMHFKIQAPAEKSDLKIAKEEYNRGPSTWITCPHCWQHFDFKDINYISRHLDLLGDPVLGADAQKRFLPVKFSARGMAIDEKGMECPEMACPHCHLKIPESVVDLPTSIFSIVGAPSSGKSYFLTTMLWQIRKCLPHFFEFNISDVDSSFNAVLNEYESWKECPKSWFQNSRRKSN